MSQQSRILDRSQYDSKTIAVFDLISAYFTDIFYNHLYDQAKNAKNSGTVPSITSGYKNALTAWNTGLSKTYFYTETIRGIYNWIINYTKIPALTYNDCINKIVIEFVPTDYFEQLSNNQKTGLLKRIISNLNKVSIKKIHNEYMDLVIDNRTRENADIIKDLMLDTLLFEKESMYQKFVAMQTAGATNSKDTMIEKMTLEIKRLIQEKCEKDVMIKNLKSIIIKNHATIEKLTETIADLQSAVEQSSQINSIAYTSTGSNIAAKPKSRPKNRKSVSIGAEDNRVENTMQNMSANDNLTTENDIKISEDQFESKEIEQLEDLPPIVEIEEPKKPKKTKTATTKPRALRKRVTKKEVVPTSESNEGTSEQFAPETEETIQTDMGSASELASIYL